MINSKQKILIIGFILLNMVFFNTAIAQTYLSTDLDTYFIDYEQKTPNQLKVHIRYANDYAEIEAKLKISNAHNISSGNLTLYPKADDKTAILFLVDVSADKTRKKVIKNNIQQIQKILESAKPYQQFGVATFGEHFTVLSAIGTDVATIAEQVNTIQANEQETLLYQYTGKAIELLEQQQAKRRVLIIFSDGKAEDQTGVYNHQSVVAKAKNKNTLVIGLAFPPKSTAGHHIRDYQTLAGLANSTAGFFFKANEKGILEGLDLSTLLDMTDNGGYWHFNLTPLIDASFAGKTPAQLEISNQQQTVDIPINLTFPALNLTLPVQEVKEVKKDKTSQIIILVIAILLLLGLLFFILNRKKTKPKVIYAYIYSLDGNEQYSINKRTYKIGRNPENDLVLANQTVSSFHAQIHLTRENEFIITDLKSANGTIVNDSEVISNPLYDDDIIEIGEVRLRFVNQQT
ncbi:MAG: FHA domain-containing protein [Thiomargarita sp.]|nr:FHA domain-containing protein [Thiomargarita sp.]